MKNINGFHIIHQGGINMQITRGNYSNQHAREIIGEEMEKISKITSRSALAATYLEEHKSRGTDEIPENLSEKMYDAIFSFKEKYAMFHSDADNLSQLLISVKIS